MIIPVPIFIYCDDDDDDELFDYGEGFSEFFLAYVIAYIGMAPLTYSILGVLNGFDAWGLKTASAVIAMFVALFVLTIGECIVYHFN
jgi:hypothetical protein